MLAGSANRSLPGRPSSVRPRFCWSFMVMPMAMAMRPSRLRPSVRSLLLKRSRPETEPPPRTFSSISTGGAPVRLKNSLIWPLAGNWVASSMDRLEAVVPSTSGWLPATNRPTVPSSAGICVVCTYWLMSRMIWSRWSSRSLGLWPLPLARAICSLMLAICLARLLMAVTLLSSCSVTVYCSSLRRSPAVRMRAAVSSRRVSTTVRAVMSVGEVTTSENAFIMSLMAAPSPAVPPLKTSCSCRRRSDRTMSAACVEPAAADWRVSSSLWLRRMVCTSTPWPM